MLWRAEHEVQILYGGAACTLAEVIQAGDEQLLVGVPEHHQVYAVAAVACLGVEKSAVDERIGAPGSMHSDAGLIGVALGEGRREQVRISRPGADAVLERNLLLVEFVETVLRDAFILKTEKLAQYQWMDFLEDRAHRDPAIGTWTESS